MPPAPPKGGGNFLTRKYGPLPGWGWAAVAAGGFILYRWNKARQAAAGTTAATTPSNTSAFTPQAVPTATYSTPGGFSYSGPLSGLGYAIGSTAAPQGAMAATNNYLGPGGNPYVPVTAQEAGYLLQTPAGAQSLAIQTAPNQVTPISSGINWGSIAPGTQLYTPQAA